MASSRISLAMRRRGNSDASASIPLGTSTQSGQSCCPASYCCWARRSCSVMPSRFRSIFERSEIHAAAWVLIAAAGPAMNIALAILSRARLSSRWLPARNRGAMGCGELEERADHQCRISCLQHVSNSATRWRTHRRRRAPGRPCLPACPARAVRDANPHCSPLRSAYDGCAIGNRSQHRLAIDCKLMTPSFAPYSD